VETKSQPSTFFFSRTSTFASGAIADVDAIKKAVATSSSAQSYSGAALDGATNFTSESPQHTKPSRTVSVTRSSNAGSYVQGSKVTFTGTLNGEAQTEEIAMPDTDGGDTLKGAKLFDEVTQIDVEAQSDASGQFEFGVEDVGGPGGGVFGFRAHAVGDVSLEFANGESDVLYASTNIDPVYPHKLVASGTAVRVEKL